MGVLAAAACAAGCGGGDGSSEREFAAQATRLCQDGNRRLLGMRMPADTAGLTALEERIEASEARLFDDLAELDAPEGRRARFERAVAARSRDAAYDDFKAAGLPDCAAFGVTGVPGGGEFNADVSPVCASSVLDLRLHAQELRPARRARRSAEDLRTLSRALEPPQPPPPGNALFDAAVADLRAIADVLDDVAAGTIGEDGTDRRRGRHGPVRPAHQARRPGVGAAERERLRRDRPGAPGRRIRVTRKMAAGAVALTLMLAACGGDGGGEAKAGGAAKTTAAAAGPLTLAQLKAKTEERCLAFTREVLAYPLPEKAADHDEWRDALQRIERRLVDDLRALQPPKAQAAAYRSALDARERTLARDGARTLEKVERTASRLAPFNPHACRYWGVRAFGEDGVQFQGDQTSYCFADRLKIEEATKRVRRGEGSPTAAVDTAATTLEKSARLMDVEPPGRGAAKRWDELRATVDDLGETIARYPRLESEAEADAFFDDLSDQAERAVTAAWTLGIGNCDFSDPLIELIEALQEREEGSSGEAA